MTQMLSGITTTLMPGMVRMAGTGPQMQQGPQFSGFEVVSNPADKWPEWSLYVVAFGLGVHFLLKLGLFLSITLKNKPDA